MRVVREPGFAPLHRRWGGEKTKRFESVGAASRLSVWITANARSTRPRQAFGCTCIWVLGQMTRRAASH
jgi:hypothetical protein